MEASQAAIVESNTSTSQLTEECSICLSGTSDAPILKLQCGHAYHQYCIECWWHAAREDHLDRLCQQIGDLAAIQHDYVLNMGMPDESTLFNHGPDGPMAAPDVLKGAEDLKGWALRCCLCTLRARTVSGSCVSCGERYKQAIDHTEGEPYEKMEVLLCWDLRRGNWEGELCGEMTRLVTCCGPCEKGIVGEWAAACEMSFRHLLGTESERQEYEYYREIHSIKGVPIPHGDDSPWKSAPELTAILDTGSIFYRDGPYHEHPGTDYINELLCQLRKAMTDWDDRRAFSRRVLGSGHCCTEEEHTIMSYAACDTVERRKKEITSRFLVILNYYRGFC